MTGINDIFKAKPSPLGPEAGRLLLSEPLLDDFFFGRSAVLLAEHNNDGSFGVVLNKPTKYFLNEVLEDIPDESIPVFMGGPVNPDSLFFIHTRPDLLGSSVKITEGIYWGGKFDDIREMLKLGMISKNMIRFFIGYSGWSPNQLDDELKRSSWVIADTAADEIMNTPPEKLWRKKIMSMGKDYSLWLNFPANPELN